MFGNYFLTYKIGEHIFFKLLGLSDILIYGLLHTPSRTDHVHLSRIAVFHFHRLYYHHFYLLLLVQSFRSKLKIWRFGKFVPP